MSADKYLRIFLRQIEAIVYMFPKIKTTCVAKNLKGNKHNSLLLAQKHVRIFVLGHYLFLKVHSFPRATL